MMLQVVKRAAGRGACVESGEGGVDGAPGTPPPLAPRRGAQAGSQSAFDAQLDASESSVTATAAEPAAGAGEPQVAAGPPNATPATPSQSTRFSGITVLSSTSYDEGAEPSSPAVQPPPSGVAAAERPDLQRAESSSAVDQPAASKGVGDPQAPSINGVQVAASSRPSSPSRHQQLPPEGSIDASVHLTADTVPFVPGIDSEDKELALEVRVFCFLALLGIAVPSDG